MKPILYTTHCPRCNVLTKKLQKANIEYEVNENVDELINLGIRTVPILKVGNEMLKFTDAVRWVDEQNAI